MAKNPLNDKEEAVKQKAFNNAAKRLQPVAKDTNKTRRPRALPMKGKK